MRIFKNANHPILGYLKGTISNAGGVNSCKDSTEKTYMRILLSVGLSQEQVDKMLDDSIGDKSVT